MKLIGEIYGVKVYSDPGTLIDHWRFESPAFIEMALDVHRLKMRLASTRVHLVSINLEDDRRGE